MPAKRPMDSFLMIHPDHNDRAIQVNAYTKSEARALIKAILGIPRNGRLPVGADVRLGMS